MTATKLLAAFALFGAIAATAALAQQPRRKADHEKAEGLAIARELAVAIHQVARGVHVMPMGKYRLAAEILEAIPLEPESGLRSQVSGA